MIVPPGFRALQAASHAVFTIFREVTPLVEPLSLDEAYLDVTENAWGEPLGMRGRAAAEGARSARTTGLTASAGVAPNKFLAKIASGWQKPDGLTVIARSAWRRSCSGSPVDALWGVGPVTARKLRAHGIERLVDVRAADPQVLRDTVGAWPNGCGSWRTASTIGRSSRTGRASRSGSENTYPDDLSDLDDDSAGGRARWRGMARGWLTRRACSAAPSRSRSATTTSRR